MKKYVCAPVCVCMCVCCIYFCVCVDVCPRVFECMWRAEVNVIINFYVE